MSIVGKIRSLGHIVVEGRIEGDLDCTSMKIGRAGILLGDIHAEEIVCSGTVEGRIRTRKFIMRKDGRHTGTVETTELRVEPGAFIDCVLHGGMDSASVSEQGERETNATEVSRKPVVDWARLADVFERNAQQCIMDVPWSERKELLDQILTLLEKDKPLIKITGEPGSGKSTLIAKLKEVLADEADLFILEEPVGSVRDLLAAVAGYFELPVLADDRQQDIVGKIRDVIAPDGCIRKRRMVLAVDDVQMMYPATMEGMIRRLTSAYEGEEGLLQIILLGTGEMEGKLVHTTREYFEDETNCLLALEPLSIKDTSEYLRFCLQVEGGGADLDPVALLPFETLKKLYAASGGNISRMNNLVAEAFRRVSQSGSLFVAIHHIQQ